MTSKTRKQTITMHILLYILRSKGNQTMKFGMLIEYIMRHLFLKKIIQKNMMEKFWRKIFLSAAFNSWDIGQFVAIAIVC